MKQGNDNNDANRYRKDIEIIKDMLIKVEESPIIEPRFFHFSGILILLATAVHFIMNVYYDLALVNLLYIVWIPMFCILIFFECIGVVRKLSAESLPLFSRTIVKLYMSVFGITISSVFIILLISRHGPANLLPSAIMVLWAVFYFQYAQVAYSFFFTHGYLTILGGIILYLSNISVTVQFILMGAFFGISMILAGFSAKHKEQIKNG